MTAASAPWWFLTIVLAIGVALVCAPSRHELLSWRHERSERGRLARAELVAGHLALKLTGDPVFLGDLALALAQALDELGIGRDLAPPTRNVRYLPLKPPTPEEMSALTDRITKGLSDAAARVTRINAAAANLTDGPRS